MKFMYPYLIPVVLLVFGGLAYLYLRQEKNFFAWIKLYWFYDRSPLSKASGLTFLAGIFLLLLSTLDLRGPEDRVKTNLPDQRTLLLIDVSQSMWAEDVRPNRLQKAILLARHFVKRAVGHQISVVIFSDIQKKLVPFTDDLDLIDSRIQALNNLNLSAGGTNLSQALMEAVEYFKTEDDITDPQGNILVFTDAEETETFPLRSFPKGISVSIVGIGTKKGGPIPIRNRDTSFQGYKKHNNEVVNTSLDEDMMKRLCSEIPSCKMFVAESYSIPTEEILSFFNAVFKKRNSESDTLIRPVMAKYLLIPAMLLITISQGLKFLPTFVMKSLLIPLLIFGFQSAHAQKKKKQQIELTAEEKDLQEEFLEDLKSGKGTNEQRFGLAQQYLKLKDYDKAIALYDEAFSSKNPKNKDPSKEYLQRMNRATAKLARGQGSDIKEGLQEYKKLSEELEASGTPEAKKLIEGIQKNTIHALKAQQKKSQKGEDQNQDKKEGAEGEGSGEGEGEGKDQKDSKDQKDQKDSNGKQQKEGKTSIDDMMKDKKKDGEGKGDKEEKEKDKGEGKDKEDKENGNGQEKDQKQDQEGNSQDGQEAKEEKVGKQKLPAILKQIVNDDRLLQQKILDTKTKQENSTSKKKDW